MMLPSKDSSQSSSHLVCSALDGKALHSMRGKALDVVDVQMASRLVQHEHLSDIHDAWPVCTDALSKRGGEE